MKTKILLADDHNIVIEGLKAVLEGDENIEVCGEAFNGQEVLNLVENGLDIDIAVLDINMPVMNGLSCAKQLKSKFPKVKVIILTMYAQKGFIEEIIKLGIEGCLLKNNTGKELKEAIQRVSGGKFYYDMIKTFTDEKDEIFQYKLSERETEILKLLAEGLTSNDIAEKLFISEFTVKTHRKNILKKAGVHNTSQLIQYAVNNKIL